MNICGESKQTDNFNADGWQALFTAFITMVEDAFVTFTSAAQAASDVSPASTPEHQESKRFRACACSEFKYISAPDSSTAGLEPKSTLMFFVIG